MAKMVRLGMVAMCGAKNKEVATVGGMVPSSAVGGWAPRPKLSAAPIK
jgi:hypothetical protein